MSDYKEVLVGRIICRGDRQPVAGAEVLVFDKDLLVSDYLGRATADAEGHFKLEFTWADYKGGFFEGRPDIFLKVKNPQSGKQTKTKVYEELKGDLTENDFIEVMDLGDVEVD